ncbi:MAG: glycosyltransferase, partial [Cyanobacteria bacterium J06636_16]
GSVNRLHLMNCPFTDRDLLTWFNRCLDKNMNVLVLAPQPFYSERGTPIAVKLILESISQRGHQADVLTYAEGESVDIENLTIRRIYQPEFTYGIRPGFSWKKIVCDGFMAIEAAKLCKTNKYDYLHAVEESVFIALALKLLFKIPYVYDMDSSLPQQLCEKYRWMKLLLPMTRFFERLAVKNSIMTLPVCSSLASSIKHYQPHKVFVLTDIALP